MQELMAQIVGLLKGLWKHRWLGLAIAWPVLAAGIVVVYLLPNKYEASARVYVDTQSVLKPLMSGMTILPNLDQQVAMMSRTLLSRPNLERVVRMADLDLKIKKPSERETLVDDLGRQIKLARVDGNNLYTIAFSDTDKGGAQRVVQSLLTIFVEGSLGDNKKDSETARKFIEEQIKAYELKLVSAENALKEFKLKYMGVMPGTGRDYFSQMQEALTRLTQARLELREAENARDELKRQLSGEVPVLLDEVVTPAMPAPVFGQMPTQTRSGIPLPDPNSVPIPTQANPQLEARIDALRKELDGLLLRYTNEHPDVISTKRLLGQLDEQKQEELKLLRRRAEEQRAALERARAAALEAQAKADAKAEADAAAAAKRGGVPSSVTRTTNNPVFQQLRVSLAESEANTASLRGRVASYETQYNELKARAGAVPQIEAEFTQLNRDYEVNKQNYQALLSRRESAQLSGEMEATSKVVDFRVIDPPRVAPKPVWPNRVLFVSIAFVAALGAGLGMAFLISQIRPTFHETKTLREVAGRPLLGTVSLIWNEHQRKTARRGLAIFAACMIAFVGVYGGGLAYFLLNSLRSA